MYVWKNDNSKITPLDLLVTRDSQPVASKFSQSEAIYSSICVGSAHLCLNIMTKSPKRTLRHIFLALFYPKFTRFRVRMEAAFESELEALRVNLKPCASYSYLDTAFEWCEAGRTAYDQSASTKTPVQPIRELQALSRDPPTDWC